MRRLLLRVPARAYAVFALLQAAFISVLSHVPGEKIPVEGYLWSVVFNLMHAPLYFALAGFLSLALLQRGEGRASLPRGRALLAVAASMAFAFADEWHQSYVSGRSSGGVDLLTDLFGAAAAAFVVHAVVEDGVPRRRGAIHAGVCAALAVCSAALAALPKTR